MPLQGTSNHRGFTWKFLTITKRLVLMAGSYIEGFAALRRVVNVTDATLAPSASDSMTLYRLNRAAGIAVTLPAAQAGLEFNFVFEVTATGAHTITAAAGDLLIGGILAVDTDTANAVVFDDPDGTDDLIFSANGSTTGGLIGTQLTFRAPTDNRWVVSGSNRHTGAFATSFS